MNNHIVRLTVLALAIAALVVLRVQWIKHFQTPPLHTASQASLAHCLLVGADMVDGIATGLTVTGGGRLDHTTARAVKSKDFESVYFIAAAIHGPGMDAESQAVGVWASNSLEPYKGMIFAVDAFANEFSDWGDGRTSTMRFSLADDGARASKACVVYRQGR